MSDQLRTTVRGLTLTPSGLYAVGASMLNLKHRVPDLDLSCRPKPSEPRALITTKRLSAKPNALCGSDTSYIYIYIYIYIYL